VVISAEPVSAEDLKLELEEIRKEVAERTQTGDLTSPRDIQEALRKSTLALVLRIRGDGDLSKEAAEIILTWRRQVDMELTGGVSIVRSR